MSGEHVWNNLIETSLDKTWYSLDGGKTNITFSGTTGTIFQEEWNKIGNGTATITFYANNSGGYEGQAEVTVRKGIIAPIITILTPTSGQIFDYPPVFDIIINELNLDSTWYTIDGGSTNITFSGTDGIINEFAWNSTPSGPITINFYAQDSLGNVGTNHVIIVKTSQQNGLPPEIPGYNLFALLGVCFIITIIISNKNRKKL